MKRIWLVVLAMALVAPLASRSQTSEDALGALKQQMQDMQQQMQKMREKINELEAAKTNAPPAERQPPSANVPGYGQAPSGGWTPSQPIPLIRAGSAYMNISFDTLLDAGWSTDPNPDANIVGRSRSADARVLAAQCRDRA